MVPGAGLEPARCCHRGILSPLRLPISPPGHLSRWALNHLYRLIVLPVFQTGLAVATGILPQATLERPALRLPISPPGHLSRWALYLLKWRRRSESNRRWRSCSPLHYHFATAPLLHFNYRPKQHLRRWRLRRPLF